jgi:hypothetical protein
MDVAYAHLAHYAEYGPEGQLTMVSGDLEALRANQFPFQYALTLVFKLVFEKSELGRDHRFRIEMMGAETPQPDGSMGRCVFEGTVQPPAGMSVTDAPVGAGIRIFFPDVRFPRQGKYPVRITANERELKTVPLRVDQVWS